MTDKNAQVFSAALLTIEEKVTNRYQRSVEDIRKQIEAKVRDYGRNAYKMMLGPFLEDRSARWARSGRDLNPDYETRKIKEGHASGFYERKGHLRRELLSRDPLKDLGRPFVSYQEGGAGGLRGGFRLNSAGKPIHASNKASGARRGQFAATRDAFRSLKTSLQVQLFPEIQGQTTDAVLLRMTSGFNTFKASIFEHGKKGQVARPLVTEFFEFYTGRAFELTMNDFVRRNL